MQRSHLHKRAVGVGGSAISSCRHSQTHREGRGASWCNRSQVGNRLVGQAEAVLTEPDAKYTGEGQERNHANSGAPGAAMASHSNGCG
jgi:hypothetical protein